MAEVIRLFADALPHWLPEDAWSDFLSHRKELKRPLTAQGVKRMLATLSKLHEQGNDIRAVLDRSMERGWSGCFALPQERPAGQSVDADAALAWAEVREAVRSGRAKVWAYANTTQALALIGGWQAVADMRTADAPFIAREFERVYKMIAGTK